MLNATFNKHLPSLLRMNAMGAKIETRNEANMQRNVPNREVHDQLRKEFSTENVKLMSMTRNEMNKQPLHWAALTFNAINNLRGTCGGVYEIREGDEIIYISGLPKNVHIRDAMNAHFSGNDGLALGAYLTGEARNIWTNMYVRFMPSRTPSEDARLLLRYHQLRNMGNVPKFN